MSTVKDPSYHQLPEKDSSESAEEEYLIESNRVRPSKVVGKSTLFYAILLVSSLLSNLFLIVQLSNPASRRNGAQSDEMRTPFAGLVRDTEMVLEKTYVFENETEHNEFWENINVDAGLVALSDEWVREHGLQLGQRFPWDDTKGIYVLEGFHSMHCLKSIHDALTKLKAKRRPIYTWDHIMHCMDSIRKNIMCEASDLPLYSTPGEDPELGIGEVKQCRSWEALTAWSHEHTACYRLINETDAHMDRLERYKFCPEGSPYIERVREVFGDRTGVE
ncbi:hypothetical protein BDY21DRAFT_103594 [Lineolata rhizophorae]|uniref:Tat pathway signal sequence n=1 Tax=Lineolata rhizophorae TaxID=578093 RepID=A0A6A6NRT3_9PEZI|nr:hypothetical protein BDY21DRAFT_103594 [Lineolata rhizophorae]